MVWTLGVLLGLAVLAAIGLQIAISRDGPVVLSAVDRILGGDGGAELKAKIAVGDHPDQKVLVWAPENTAHVWAPENTAHARMTSGTALRPVLLFVHGGSWNSGDPESYDFVGRAFAEQGFVVVLSGYRLGEAGKYPGMIEDTASAFAWARQEIAQYGGDPQNIVIAGHSAGAYNMMMVALESRWLEPHGLSPKDIAAVVGISGPYDFLPLDSESTIASFGHVDDLDATQPINHVSENSPPMLLLHGKKDTTVGVFHSRNLSGLLQEAGHAPRLELYPEKDHTDPLVSIAAPWRGRRDVVPKIAEFVRQTTASR